MLATAVKDGWKMEWTMSASPNKAEVRLVWTPAPEPPSQAQKKKSSPATRKRNTERSRRHKEKKAVVDKADRDTQTPTAIPVKHHAEVQTKAQKTTTVSQHTITSPVKTADVASTVPSFNQGHQLTPSKYRIPDVDYVGSKPYSSCDTIRSPYDPRKSCYKTTFDDGEVHFSEGFDLDNVDYPDHSATHPPPDPGERPPTPSSSSERPKKKKAKSHRQLHL